MNAVVVTGAGSGIGRACAQLLSRRGCHVVGVGRRQEALEETIAQLSDPGSAQAISADITTDAGIDAVRRALQGRELAGIVHAAGRESLRALGATDREEIDAVFATNVIGPLLLTRALTAQLEDGASMVFVSSIAALHGRDRHAAYGASKAALLGLTYNLAVELAPRVRVNTVIPGPVQTAMIEQYLAEYLGPEPSEQTIETIQLEAKRVPLQRIAHPDEIAATIAHLLLDASAVTGTCLPVDLGYTAR
jgi:NAD(P)-dependent dehydrogenase (short-subunit alcohol dehydrogenase family)